MSVVELKILVFLECYILIYFTEKKLTDNFLTSVELNSTIFSVAGLLTSSIY